MVYSSFIETINNVASDGILSAIFFEECYTIPVVDFKYQCVRHSFGSNSGHFPIKLLNFSLSVLGLYRTMIDSFGAIYIVIKI